MKIKDTQTALNTFENACIKHLEATERGDYKTANRYHSQILKAVNFLKSENNIHQLERYLCSSFVSVRLWAACYLLSTNEKEGLKVLEEIVKSSGISSLTAEITLDEWKNGNLKF